MKLNLARKKNLKCSEGARLSLQSPLEAEQFLVETGLCVLWVACRGALTFTFCGGDSFLLHADIEGWFKLRPMGVGFNEIFVGPGSSFPL